MKLTKQEGPGRAIHDWWREIADVPDPAGGKLRSDRASRAILRRAHDITAVTLCAPYQRLHRMVRQSSDATWDRPHRRDGLAAVAGLLAHVSQEKEGERLAASMSRGVDEGQPPALSELRFQRLLESDDLDTLFRGLRRALPLMKGTVDVITLANDVIDWSDAWQRDRVKKHWAYSYRWPTGAHGK
jgi:CRISPR system Cascade subunit CasB